MSNKPGRPPKWAREASEAVFAAEARLLMKVQAERSAREREGAFDEEQFEQLTNRLDELREEQARWIERVRAIERQLPLRPHKKKAKGN